MLRFNLLTCLTAIRTSTWRSLIGRVLKNASLIGKDSLEESTHEALLGLVLGKELLSKKNLNNVSLIFFFLILI